MINIIIYIILSIVVVIANFCALLLIGDSITIIWTWFKKKEICETKKELLFSNTTGLDFYARCYCNSLYVFDCNKLSYIASFEFKSDI